MLSESTRDQLFDYLDGRLEGEAQTAFERRLETDEELQQAWETLREFHSAGRDWEDVAVPAWSRLRGVTAPNGGRWSATLGWLSLSTSLAALLLVIFQVQFSLSGDGFSVRFGRAPDGLSELQLESRMAEFEASRLQYMNQRLDLMDKKNQAINRQLVAAALEYNRIERQEEIRALVASWNRARSTDLMRVDDLRDNQFDDRMAIRQLYTRLPEATTPRVR